MMRLFFMYAGEIHERFIENLINANKFCISCEPYCDECRLEYGSYVDDIIGIHQFPEDLPDFIEEPEEFLPKTMPETDILIAINVHADILTALPDFLEEFGIKGLIVPIEDGEWVPLGLQKQVEEELKEKNIQYAFPRPFCSLDFTGQPLIDQFIDRYKIGRPKVELIVENGRIKKGKVIRSSPCGCAWYLVRQLVRFEEPLDETLNEKISKAHHSYPCNASMKVDPVLKETPLHEAGYIHRFCVYEGIKADKKYDIIEEEAKNTLEQIHTEII
ncbi:MAG: DUF166 domain-containing protein [Candidatus Helarchaeales archaeon]